jgi:hypothetical protein
MANIFRKKKVLGSDIYESVSIFESIAKSKQRRYQGREYTQHKCCQEADQ